MLVSKFWHVPSGFYFFSLDICLLLPCLHLLVFFGVCLGRIRWPGLVLILIVVALLSPSHRDRNCTVLFGTPIRRRNICTDWLEIRVIDLNWSFMAPGKQSVTNVKDIFLLANRLFNMLDVICMPFIPLFVYIYFLCNISHYLCIYLSICLSVSV